MTSTTQTFALSPRSQLGSSDMDPLSVTYTQTMDGRGQDTTLRESTRMLMKSSVDHTNFPGCCLYNFVDIPQPSQGVRQSHTKTLELTYPLETNSIHEELCKWTTS